MRLAALLMALALLGACAKKPESALESPDHVHVAELYKTEVKLLPFYRVTLRRMDGDKRVVVAEGFQSMCGVFMNWQGDSVFEMRLPVPEARHFKAAWAEFDGVSIRRELHEDFVGLQALSPDKKLRLVQIQNCERTQWDIYLRSAGSANYSADMEKGWADESVAGGFDQRRVLKSITWHGNASAEILIQGNRGQVQTRDLVKGVKLNWKFLGGVNSNDQIIK